jgi:hypothetical protein
MDGWMDSSSEMRFFSDYKNLEKMPDSLGCKRWLGSKSNPKSLKKLKFFSKSHRERRETLWSDLKDSMIHLHLGNCSIENLEFVVNKLKRLKSLKMEDFLFGRFFPSIKYLKFEPNESIVKLKIPYLNSDMEDLMRSLINLEVLEVKEITGKNELEILVRFMKRLKKLTCEWQHDDQKNEIIEIYEHLKGTKQNINNDIKIVWSWNKTLIK